MGKKLLRVYILLFSVSLLLLIIDGFSGIKIGNRCYSFFSLNLRSSLSRFSRCDQLKKENENLLEKIAAIFYEKQMYEELKKENLELKEIFKFKFNYPQTIIPAEIERKTPEEISLSFQIDKGSSDGVELNASVIGFRGVVGKVLKVSDHTSLVQTLKNYNSALSILDTRSGVRGIIKWNRTFFLEGIPQYVDLREGDTLVTSGEGSVFPRGLPVGIVTYTEKNPNDYSLKTEVETFENFDKLDFLFVIKR